MINIFLKKIILLAPGIYIFLPTNSWSQGVRSSCAGEYCGGRVDLTWFWIVGLSLVVAFFLFKLLFGNSKERRKSVSFFVSVAKGLALILGLPAVVHFVIGGESAIFAFYAVLALTIFYPPIFEWIVGKSSSD